MDQIGVTQLRALDPTLTGSGVRVGQPEAQESTNNFEVNPASIGQPSSLFTYYSSTAPYPVGATGNPPNLAGGVSGHATTVGDIFYGNASSPAEGVAPGVSHVDNYDAGYFFNTLIAHGIPVSDKVINQSFVFTGSNGASLSGSNQQSVDLVYDQYIATNNVIIVSGAGNGGQVNAPATSYNGIGVAAYGGASSVGPTIDNGRSKPDITAPAGATSFSTPLVSGAATILVQAGTRGDGGVGTSSDATDSRTIKALLLNGAVKPADWTRVGSEPLDRRYGAGIVNVYNSYLQLRSGDYHFTTTSTSTSGSAPLPPSGVTGNIASLSGWDLDTISQPGGGNADVTNHYFFALNSGAGQAFDLTATLTWNRQAGQSNLNNLDLYLFGADGLAVAPISSSISTVDNVEHLFLTDLSPGRYDLEVFMPKSGALVSPNETYALAYNFVAVPEPTSVPLIALSTAAMVVLSRRRRRT